MGQSKWSGLPRKLVLGVGVGLFLHDSLMLQIEDMWAMGALRRGWLVVGLNGDG